MPKSLSLFLAGFSILFCLYHLAEYMIVFQNSAIGFLGFQAAFFGSAWLIAKWQFNVGLSAWGLDAKKSLFKQLAWGAIMGIVLYGLTYFISNLLDIEKLTFVPSFSAIASPLSLFVFGSFFSSFSEDILTRGYLYRHFSKKIRKEGFVLISAVVYWANHIYRFHDSIATGLYLLGLGILFAIPLVLTKRLWFTGGMHWAGNCFFYLTHEIFKNQESKTLFSPNYILFACTLLFIPLSYALIRLLRLELANADKN